MKLRRIDPTTIVVPEVRVTARFDPEALEQFRQSIKDTGQIAPIICCEVEGQMTLVDGLHRLSETLQNGTPRIDVAVIPGDLSTVLAKNLFLDHLRGKTPVSEMVNVIETLWKEYEWDSERIATETGMTRDYVEKLQTISELTPLCRQALDEERIKVGHAAALARMDDPIRQETVLGQLIMYRWTVKELEQYIKEVLDLVRQQVETTPSETRQQPTGTKCFYCGETYDFAKIANPATCHVCSGILLQAQAEARREAQRTEEPQDLSLIHISEPTRRYAI